MSSTTSPFNELVENDLEVVRHEMERVKEMTLLAEVTVPELLTPGVKEDPVEHALQLRRLNAIQPNISVLPVETLSTIFEFAYLLARPPENLEEDWEEPCVMNAPLASTLALSAVSHHWRQVAVSTPKLWQSLEIWVEDQEMSEVEAYINLLQLCIDRSNSWIDLILNYRIIADTGTILRSLSLPETPGVLLDQIEWLVFIKSPQAIKKLTLLSIDRTRLPHMAFLLALLQQLEVLKVDCREVYHEHFGVDVARFRDNLGPRLTVLDLSYYHYRLAVELLLHCPNLIQCRSLLTYSKDTDTWDQPNGNNRILGHLQWLEWDAIMDHSSLRFATISVPALRGLKWSHCMLYDRDPLVAGIDAAFLQFLSTATRLTEFEIALRRFLVAPSSRILELLPRIIEVIPHSVQKLTLHVALRQLACIPSPFITPLMGRPSTQSSLRVPLPSLKALFLMIESEPEGRSVRREDWVATNLVIFLRQRWQLGLVHEFHLGFNFTCKWDDGVYEGFRELVREGLKLKIEINGRPVQWL